MKASSYVAPLVALLAAGIWLGSQRMSMAELEKQNAALLAKLGTVPTSPVTAKKRAPGKTPLDAKPIDWKEVARLLDDGRGDGGSARYLKPNMRLIVAFESMSREQILNSLQEVAAADLGDDEREVVEDALYAMLRDKDPAHAIDLSLQKDPDDSEPARLLRVWAERDLAAATAWLDQQIAEGNFGKLEAGDGMKIRVHLERELFAGILLADPAAAAKRLAALPEDQRALVFQRSLESAQVSKIDPLGFARMVREQLPVEHQADVIVMPLTDRGGLGSYQEVDDYLAKIQASPEERKACILGVAKRACFPRSSGEKFKVQTADLEALRDWAGKMAPELKSEASTLAVAGSVKIMPYPEAVAFAMKCHAEDGNDAILEALLHPSSSRGHEELVREVIDKVSDPETKERLRQKAGQ